MLKVKMGLRRSLVLFLLTEVKKAHKGADDKDKISNYITNISLMLHDKRKQCSHYDFSPLH